MKYGLDKEDKKHHAVLWKLSVESEIDNLRSELSKKEQTIQSCQNQIKELFQRLHFSSSVNQSLSKRLELIEKKLDHKVDINPSPTRNRVNQQPNTKTPSHTSEVWYKQQSNNNSNNFSSINPFAKTACPPKINNLHVHDGKGTHSWPFRPCWGDGGPMLCISSMPVYRDLSLEELRFQDYTHSNGVTRKHPFSTGPTLPTYTPTVNKDFLSRTIFGDFSAIKFHNITAMPDYADKSQEELRFAHYRRQQIFKTPKTWFSFKFNNRTPDGQKAFQNLIKQSVGNQVKFLQKRVNPQSSGKIRTQVCYTQTPDVFNRRTDQASTSQHASTNQTSTSQNIFSYLASTGQVITDHDSATRVVVLDHASNPHVVINNMGPSAGQKQNQSETMEKSLKEFKDSLLNELNSLGLKKNFEHLETCFSTLESKISEVSNQMSILDSKVSSVDMFVTMERFGKRWQELEPKLANLESACQQSVEDKTDSTLMKAETKSNNESLTEGLVENTCSFPFNDESILKNKTFNYSHISVDEQEKKSLLETSTSPNLSNTSLKIEPNQIIEVETQKPEINPNEERNSLNSAVIVPNEAQNVAIDNTSIPLNSERQTKETRKNVSDQLVSNVGGENVVELSKSTDEVIQLRGNDQEIFNDQTKSSASEEEDFVFIEESELTQVASEVEIVNSSSQILNNLDVTEYLELPSPKGKKTYELGVEAEDSSMREQTPNHSQVNMSIDHDSSFQSFQK